MKILICFSEVPDTTTKIKFINNNTALDKEGIQWIINPWDELALTRALELKETGGGKIEKVTVITVGPKECEPTIRKALAIGADDAIRINAEPKDAYFVAFQLAEVLKKETYEIIFCGIESSDYNDSLVGGMLSEFLEIPSVSSVSNISFEGDALKIIREIDGGKETLTTQLPFVAIVQKGIAKEPRIPSMRGIMTARTKPLKVIEPVEADSLTEFIGFEYPKAKETCKFIAPENVKELVNLLHNEAKII